ncbi:acyl-CoA N-acyltransferase [Pseudomassariella vexata]|uniref:Acyl-CoA N-acyltransferase n=1 Tax=Pseudomassariella vexata TaxID=1141098 RepID=A0A1Y2DGZ2_9PEZI|nr:acyl-CoA N-acyltransferase [Pseudomassariella vexata]ORY58543.1 acyl-CoA N-acyltransferase [Pseudomassariella vexata]
MSNSTDIIIVLRQISDLAALVELFKATYQASNYPVDGPPGHDDIDRWLPVYLGGDALVEILALVPCRAEDSEAGANNGASREKSMKQPQTSASPPGRRKVLGHVSLRRVSENSITSKMWRDAGFSHDGDLWEVCRLAVDPDFQEKGIGRRLLEATEIEAQKSGAKLVLGVLEKDTVAIRMYERKGWKVFGKDKLVRQDGKYHTEYFYIHESDNRGLIIS